MMLKEVAPVPDGELPVQALKDHLRLGSGFSDDGLQDGLVRGYLRAAFAALEGRIGKALITRRFVWQVAQWRGRDGQALPLAPVVGVEQVALVDPDGGTVLVAADRWRLEADLHRPRLLPKGAPFPAVPEGGRVEVMFDAGFGLWAEVPPDLQQAVLMLAAQYHEFRHDGGLDAGALPFGVMALIERWRTVRVLGGRG